MFLMRADTLRGQLGGDWALEMESFLGPVKWHRAGQGEFGQWHPGWGRETRNFFYSV